MGAPSGDKYRSERSALGVQQVAEAAWLVAREERSARFHGYGYCPTKVAPYGSADPEASGIRQICRVAGCLDLHHELIARLLKKLGSGFGSAIDNPGAYGYRTARTELVDLKRRDRTAVGFPAKPTRLDGAAGRVDAALRMANGPDGEWLSILFRILRSYPFSPHHVAGRWPVDGLATERARHFPTDADQVAAVKRDITVVLERAGEIAGHRWVYDNLTLPLNASGIPTELPGNCASDANNDLHALMGRMLWQAYLRERASGLDPHEALDAAAREVTGLGAPAHTQEVKQALAEIESGADGCYPVAG